MVPVNFLSYHKKGDAAPLLFIAFCVVKSCNAAIGETNQELNEVASSRFAVNAFRLTVPQQNNRTAWICLSCLKKHHDQPDALIRRLTAPVS